MCAKKGTSVISVAIHVIKVLQKKILNSRKILSTANNIAAPTVHFVNLARVSFFCNSKVNIIQFYTLAYQYVHYVFQLLNELELHCKSRDGDSSSIEQFKSNWTSISLKVKNFLESHNDYLLANDQETTPGMLISIFTNNYNMGSMWLINLSYCSLFHPFLCNNQENGIEYM